MQHIQQGLGQVLPTGDTIRLLRPGASTKQYHNAQLQDYRSGGLPHQAPLSLRLEARFSHANDELIGTAGFGLWNAPYQPPRLPKAAWFFFGSPPLELPFAMGVAGNGFKAATLDAANWRFLALLPSAPLGFLLCRIPSLYRYLWPIGQRALKVSEMALVHDLTAWHQYGLDWQAEGVTFWLDGQVIHRSPYSPTGRMGLVIWVDNQYAIVTPQGRLGWGLLASQQDQWLEIKGLSLHH
jgi:hypothetical protein